MVDDQWSQLNSKHLSHTKINHGILKPTMCGLKFHQNYLFSIPSSLFFPSFWLATFGIQCTFHLSFTFIDILYVSNLEMRMYLSVACWILTLTWASFWFVFDSTFTLAPVATFLANWNFGPPPFGT